MNTVMLSILLGFPKLQLHPSQRPWEDEQYCSRMCLQNNYKLSLKSEIVI